MDYIKLSEVAETFLANAVTKSQLSVSQLLLRGFLSGALLGFATTVAFAATAQGLPPVLGAASFPLGFAMIVVLGLELLTGSFAMLPAAFLAGRVGLIPMLRNLLWVFLGNLIGGCLYGWMYAQVQTLVSSCNRDGCGRVDRGRCPGQNAGIPEAGRDRLLARCPKGDAL
jgi:formate/nitrite transporter FocA (FNT family)